MDPGVFVITQIKECRNRMGYCILGSSCDVDSDFVKDDLGGHCERLSEAFNPRATFVCCRQNPANFEAGDIEDAILGGSLEAAGTEPAATPQPEERSTLFAQPSSSIVTELVTQLATETETVTAVESVTRVVTEIITEIVRNTGAGQQADRTTTALAGGAWLEPVTESGWKEVEAGATPREDEEEVITAGPWVTQQVTQSPPEVYEFDIGQTITGLGPPEEEGAGSVLRPGQVIDDPSLLQSIVGLGLNVEAEAPAATGQAAVGAVGSVVEVPLAEYPVEYPVEYQAEYPDYPGTEQDFTEPKEPELHCDLSILLSGISCSFLALDRRTQQPSARPLLAPARDPLGDQEYSSEEYFSESGGWTALAPAPALDPAPVSVSEGQALLAISEEEVIPDIKLPPNLLVSELGLISSEIPKDNTNDFVAKTYNKSKIITESNKPDAEKDKRFDKSQESKVTTFHVGNDHLNNLQQDEDLLQHFIEQIELATNTSITSGSSSPSPAAPGSSGAQCGVKGGKAVEDAYGKEASKYILPLLIESWVFGKDSSQKARFDSGQARIGGGQVTSTVLYCWLAAIQSLQGEFVCTGTLAAPDLVITSASCINL